MFSHLGVDFKIFKYDVVIEFHSTFFALFPDTALTLIRKFIKSNVSELNFIYHPIRIDGAVDVINYEVNDFMESVEDDQKAYFSFAAKERVRETKNKKLETIYYYGSKTRWVLCIYDKALELEKKWKKMTEDKRAYYKDYRGKKITRFELRFKKDYIERHLLESFYDDKVTSEELTEMMFASWSKRRTIYKTEKGEVVDRNNNYKFEQLEIWRLVFKSNNLGKGAPFLRIKTVKPLLTKKKLISKLAKILNQGDSEMLIDYSEMHNALFLARKEARERERQCREGYNALLRMIAA